MKLSHTVIYVDDVPAAIEFYERAFSLKRRFIHESGQYGEMDTGSTTLAFTGRKLANSLVPCGFRANHPSHEPVGMQISFEPDGDVLSAFAKATAAGASVVTEPEHKPWGWISAMVRDRDGTLVELAQRVKEQIQ